MIELRTAQKLFLEKAEESRKRGDNKGILIFATGLGKTLSALSDALRVTKEYEQRTGKRGKILVLAHNHNLLFQHARDFKLLCNDRKIGFLYKSKKDTNAEVLFANIMTLKKKKYLYSFRPKEFVYIIVDETHHVGAKSYKIILEYLKPKFLLGMTATPNRTDQIDILPFYDNNVIINIDIFEAINKKWLRPYKYIFLWDKWCNYEKIKSYRMNNGHYKYDTKELGRAYYVPERDKAIIEKFKDIAGNRRGIGFCVSVNEARRMADLFNKNGVNSVAIWGGSGKGRTMKETKRNKILEDYESGKYQMIFNCELIGEGLHFPCVDVVLKLRPTMSSIKDNQHNGRGLYNIDGLKINGNKYEKLLILDWVGNYNKSYANYIYQGKPKENKDKKINDIREIIEMPIDCEVEFEERVIEEFNKQINSEKKNKSFFIYNKERIIKLFNKEKDILKLAKQLECSPTTLRKYLYVWGIKLKEIPSKKSLINEFYRMKSLLGKKPTYKEIDKYGKYHHKKYLYWWDSWNNFLVSIKEEIRYYRQTDVTKKDLIKNYKNLKKLLKKQISIKDINNKEISKYGVSLYQGLFGSWSHFKKIVGDKVLNYSPSKKELKKSFLMIRKKHSDVGFTELQSYGGYHISNYRKKWGNVNNFLKELGLPEIQHSPSRRELIEDYLNVKEKIKKIPIYEDMKRYGKFHPQTIQKRWESWSSFLKEIEGTKNLKGRCFRNRMDLQEINKKFLEWCNLTKKPLYKKSKGGNGIDTKEFCKWLGISRDTAYRSGFRLKDFIKEYSNESNKIKIFSEYKPKTIIIPIKQKRKGLHKTYEGLHKEEYHSKEDKMEIRKKIVSKIQDGDNVLLLESPELFALKEIEKRGIKPNKIVIPNHLEFKKLANVLKNYKTSLNIECINTSALQYLVDSDEKFDFVWLDYCGAFSYYMRDLDILFAKHFGEMRLILTYNLFDPIKDDENYYFTRVIDYVLDKVSGKSKVRLINDVTYRYKKNMYNIGFDIQEIKNE